MSNHLVDSIKLQLKSALKRKLLNEKQENDLRHTERSLMEEICMLTNEIDLLIEQLEELTKNISEMKYQIAMIEICNASEKCKVQQQIENLSGHTEGFQALFAKEQQVLQIQLEQLKAKEAEIDDLKKKELESYEQQQKKVIAVEDECKAIESECNVLKKRNKAMMLKLRRKLLETDEIRRELIKNKHTERY